MSLLLFLFWLLLLSGLLFWLWMLSSRHPPIWSQLRRTDSTKLSQLVKFVAELYAACEASRWLSMTIKDSVDSKLASPGLSSDLQQDLQDTGVFVKRAPVPFFGGCSKNQSASVLIFNLPRTISRGWHHGLLPLLLLLMCERRVLERLSAASERSNSYESLERQKNWRRRRRRRCKTEAQLRCF